jgi:hypothetical protein
MDEQNKNLGLVGILDAQDEEYHRCCQAIANYEASMKGAILNGQIVLGDLYDWYKAQKPNLHRFCNDSRIDLAALTYALQRHAESITRVEGVYLLSKSDKSERNVTRVKCKVRNRAMFDLGRELEIVVREKEADSYDIVSCAIMYGIEAKKIKKKLGGDAVLLKDIKDIESKTELERNQIVSRLANTLGVDFNKLQKYNAALDHRLFAMLENIVKHEPEKMILKFDPEFIKSDYPANAKAWRMRIEDNFEEYKDRPILIISSDTHSVVNCLTGFAEKNRDLINRLANQNPALRELNGGNHGLLYYKLQQLCKTPEGKELFKAKIEYEESLGIKFIRDKNDTGIDVQIIDVRKLFQLNAYDIDPRIKINREKAKLNGPIILNMDYSFGKQGRHSMQELCHTFKHRIQGIAFIGKAGIVCDGGNKFDIMLPTHVQKQIEGGIYFFPNRNQLTNKDFNGMFDGGVYDGGPMLTVPGTVMQTDSVFNHYKEAAKIIGAEMEAAHYLDSIVKAHAYGLLRQDLGIYVGYWASDNPLNAHESLAEEHMSRGYVPLYSLICATLNKAINQGLEK